MGNLIALNRHTYTNICAMGTLLGTEGHSLVQGDAPWYRRTVPIDVVKLVKTYYNIEKSVREHYERISS